ncbi:MAG TPA: hypothetical protein DHV36_16560 [Desulfobacteraceae bacterium]|nr:hypothetical protein [Desulfobacteraceae bacterium]|tara:strand:- start:863 stop:1645 length:783 start_codon:yes stop_codon:yes gene_type:complete
MWFYLNPGGISLRTFLRFLSPFFIGWVLFFLTVSEGHSQDRVSDVKKVTISAIVNEQTHAIAKHVLKEVYRRIDYEVEFNDLPGERALAWANNGMTDGDVARISGTQKKYTNLIQIKTPVIHFKGVAFTKNITKPIARWEDIREFRIGVVRGVRYSTIGTRGMVPFFANDMTQLFTILDRGRIEIAVAVLDAGKIEIERNFKNSGIHVTGTPLFSSPLYHFINVRNQHLVEKLEHVLNEMTRSGEINEIRKKAIRKLTER